MLIKFLYYLVPFLLLEILGKILKGVVLEIDQLISCCALSDVSFKYASFNKIFNSTINFLGDKWRKVEFYHLMISGT